MFFTRENLLVLIFSGSCDKVLDYIATDRMHEQLFFTNLLSSVSS